MKTFSYTVFCRAGIFYSRLSSFIFLNSITAGFDFGCTVPEGPGPALLLNFLPFLAEDRNKGLELYTQGTAMACGFWRWPSGFPKGPRVGKKAGEEWPFPPWAVGRGEAELRRKVPFGEQGRLSLIVIGTVSVTLSQKLLGVFPWRCALCSFAEWLHHTSLLNRRRLCTRSQAHTPHACAASSRLCLGGLVSRETLLLTPVSKSVYSQLLPRPKPM